MRLEGLRDDEARELLKWRGMPGDAGTSVEELVRGLRGHPLLLRMSNQAKDIKELCEGNIARFLHGEIYSRLDPQEAVALNTLAVLRSPVAATHLAKRLGYQAIESLYRKALVEQAGEGIALHDLMRSFLLSYITEGERRRCHRLAHDILPPIEPFRIERLYHAISAGSASDALREISADIERLIASGYASNILTLLDAASKGDIPSSMQKDALVIRMKCLSFIGKFRTVIETYEKRLREGRPGIDEMVTAADACLETGELKKALDIYSGLEKQRIEGGTRARVLRGLGRTHASIGNYDDARKYFLRALSAARRMGREEMIGLSLLDLGSIEVYREQKLEATDHFLEAMRYLRKDEQSLARIYGNLGLVYYQRSKFETALEMIGRAEATFKARSDYVGMLKSMLNKSLILCELERYDDSEATLLHLLEITRQAGMRTLIISCMENLSYLYLSMGRFSDSKAMAKDMLRLAMEEEDKYLIAGTKNNLGFSLIKLGREKKGINILKESLRMGIKIGAHGINAETNMLLSEGYRIIGQRSKSKYYEDRAMKLASERGVLEAVKRAKRVIEKSRAIK